MSKRSRSSSSDEEENSYFESRGEYYEWMVDRLKRRKKYADVLMFPRCEEEEIGSDMVAMSHEFWEEQETEDDPWTGCDICGISLPVTHAVGKCMRCQKRMGTCCLYSSQWADSYDKSEIPSDTQLLCPVCIEGDTFSSTQTEEESVDEM